MKELDFYKEQNGEWYVDLPGWTGSKAELQMVAGADDMLEIMAAGRDRVSLQADVSSFEGATELLLRGLGGSEGGGYYFVEHHNGARVDLELWLCDVTNFVFGFIPEKIYVRTR